MTIVQAQLNHVKATCPPGEQVSHEEQVARKVPDLCAWCSMYALLCKVFRRWHRASNVTASLLKPTSDSCSDSIQPMFIANAHMQYTCELATLRKSIASGAAKQQVALMRPI